MDVGLQRKIDQAFGPMICRALSLFSGGRVSSELPEENPDHTPVGNGKSRAGTFHVPQDRGKIPASRDPCPVVRKEPGDPGPPGVVPPENVMTLSDRSLGQLVSDSLAAFERCGGLRFDVVIDCELFARVSSIFAFFSAAPVRVGFHRHTMEGLYRGDFINRPVLYNPYRHISDQFLALVDAIESQSVPKNKFDAFEEVPKEAPAMRLQEGELGAMVKRLPGRFSRHLREKTGAALPQRGDPAHPGMAPGEFLQDREGSCRPGLRSGGDRASRRQGSCPDHPESLPEPVVHRSDGIHEDNPGASGHFPHCGSADHQRRWPRAVRRHDADPVDSLLSVPRPRPSMGPTARGRRSFSAGLPARHA